MQPEERVVAYLWDMREAARSVFEFVQGVTYHTYCRDKKLRSTVERQIEIIGEAARHVSPQFQTEHPDIPWRLIIAQRNVLIHDYGDVKNERIWQVATVHVPELIRKLDPLIPPTGE